MAAEANRPTKLTGQSLERDRRCQRGVVLADRGDHGQPRQPSCGLDQLVGTHPGEFALPQLGQRARVIVVGEHAQVDAFGDDAVLDVVHRIGDVVGPVHHLCLQARAVRRRTQTHPGRGLVVLVVEPEFAFPVTARPRIFGDRVQGCSSQVQPSAIPLCVKYFGLKAGQDSEILRIALEAAMLSRDLVERLLAVVSIGRVSDVVGQAGQLDQIEVAAQPDCHPTPDLRHLQRVRQPGARSVTLTGSNDLRLVGQPSQCGAV